MSNQSDDELIRELNRRFAENRQALYDLKMTTKKLEDVNRKLQESEEIKSHFLSNIKNEINNPLTSILGLSQQLASNKSFSPEMIATLGRMLYKEAFSLDFHMRNIFAAAELESGEVQVNVSLVDVPSLVQSVIDSFSHLTRDKGVSFQLNLDDAARKFKTDPEKLNMVMINLVSNAIEFSRPQQEVVVTAHVEDGRLQISVSDRGIGIDPADVNLIFDRFRQLDSGTTKGHQGQGLGLSITKAIIDLMEGDISVLCEKDKGCTFTITIPEVEADVEADAFAVDGNEFLFDDDGAEAF